MPSKTLVVLSAVAILGLGSTAMAKGGGGGGGGGKGGSGGHVGHAGHAPFHARFDRRFLRNQFLLGGWGGWGWGWPDGEGGYSNTEVGVYPQATPQFATGSVAATPCHWNSEKFTVPSSGGGTQPVEVVSCR